jgi:ribulose-5-phosphate 4-epimerase/fuculose-1-phosphate aldolase
VATRVGGAPDRPIDFAQTIERLDASGDLAMNVAVRPTDLEMSDAEWRTRCDLAALYRIVDHLGWTDLLDTHMSARVPGEPGRFLINHYEEMFDEITASSLIKMDVEGNVIGKQGRFNAAGFTIHSGIYKARADANCVMHTHTRAGGGVSMLRKGLRPISQDALLVLDEVVYHEYGVPTTQEECDALGVSCQKGTCVILHNHGLLSHAPTMPGALRRLYMMERACELELIARQLDEPPILIEDYIVARAAQRMKQMRESPEYGVKEWNALLRVIEKKTGGDYRR